MATSVLASLQIQVLSHVYSRVAVKLNNFENYRTETAYENSLIFKTFIFQVKLWAILVHALVLPRGRSLLRASAVQHLEV